MNAIILKTKPDSSIPYSNLIVFDELIKGTLTNEWFVPVFTDAKNGMRVITVSYLINNYLFPKNGDKININLYHFLCGAECDSIKEIEFYQTSEIDFF